MRGPWNSIRCSRGMTLIELMIATSVLTLVIIAVILLLTSSSHAQAKTAHRVSIQSGCRETLALMTTELRQAGADPSNPPVGVLAVVYGDSVTLHIRSDLNGNGTIETVEPSEDVTYSYNPATSVITRDPGAGAAVILDKVTGFRFTYFDITNQPLVALPLSITDAAAVHSVGLSITSVNQDSRPITINTRVTMRNR